ncbi:MAG: sigma-54 dependent transcriptional regulator [Planctomycetota bacterium]|jgi:DNA-binding NtrC family response regulator|nr:sigma-54 dependent transcriptional regulator [Acidimicrobiales bacterium]MDA1202280.1 sigma-54 dependent transcriptional regulator [Planctomycetota bacterium]
MSDVPVAPVTRHRILVVDDDRRMASGRAEWLCSRGWHAFAAGSAAEAVRSPGREQAFACLVDALLPDDGGRRVADAVRAASPTAGVVAVVPHEAAAPSWADAVVTMPGRDDAILAALEAAHHAATLDGSPSTATRTGLVGQHPGLLHVLDIMDRVARTPATVLITGESGTGKSLLARQFHTASRRPGRFVEVACGCLAEPLLDSELFGHVAGAFTGATADRSGKFLQADGGTIFLDEIATASPALQVKLLRVLQEMEFEPVGGGETKAVDARVILATNDDLARLVAEGRFREDLFWRINVVTIEMPPLRERAADIPLLADHFLWQAARQAGRRIDGLAPETVATLVGHAWPGNVRELQHAIERAVFLGRSPVVEPGDLPAAVLASGASLAADHRHPLKNALAAPERQLILDALERSGWRRDIAARSLGINRTTLYKKLKRLGLDVADLQPAR